ncbi:MAG: T9SS type A sorting domain-containing protein [Chitinophagales bacterium]|nr:T9SS type A sorting domain-containing protein [Chitinophagales bacterium]
MKKILTLFALAAALFSISMTEQDSIPKPPLQRTGAPGETYCTDCHGGTALNGGPGGMTLTSSGNNKYVPGKSYTITVTVFDASESARGGFETTILDDKKNLPAGTCKVTDHDATLLRNDKNNGRVYMSNYQGVPYETWSYKWTAPATDIGTITIYCATNASNDDFTPMGDHIYSGKLTLTPKIISRLGADVDDKGFSVYPTVIHQQLTADFSNDESGNVQIALFNLQGQQQEVLYSSNDDAGNYEQTLSLKNQYTPGVYFIALQQGGSTQVQKVMIQ